MMAKLIEVIQTSERRGEGKDATDPCRIVVQYYEPKEGRLLAEVDTFNKSSVEINRLHNRAGDLTAEIHDLKREVERANNLAAEQAATIRHLQRKRRKR